MRSQWVWLQTSCYHIRFPLLAGRNSKTQNERLFIVSLMACSFHKHIKKLSVWRADREKYPTSWPPSKQRNLSNFRFSDWPKPTPSFFQSSFLAALVIVALSNFLSIMSQCKQSHCLMMRSKEAQTLFPITSFTSSHMNVYKAKRLASILLAINV